MEQPFSLAAGEEASGSGAVAGDASPSDVAHGAESLSRKRPRAEESAQEEAELPIESARRGVRASFYRPSTIKSSASSDEANSRAAAVPCPRDAILPLVRSPHETLLDACEEGEYDAVMACLQQPDVDMYINLHGYARNVVAARCPETGAVLEWGHPEALTAYRGDTPLRYAAFHGYARIVEALLAAGAVPSLRNDDAKGAKDLAELGGSLMTKKKSKEVLAAQGPAKEVLDLPRGDAAERAEVVQMLKEALAAQWVIINYSATLNGRVAQVVGVMQDGRRLCIINDAAASAHRPYYEKSAVTSAYLWQDNLLKIPPPPPSAKLRAWPLDARFCCYLSGRQQCECECNAAAAAPVQGEAEPLMDAAPAVDEHEQGTGDDEMAPYECQMAHCDSD